MTFIHPICDACGVRDDGFCKGGPHPEECPYFERVIIEQLPDDRYWEILEEILDNTPASEILKVPKVAELLAEHFESQILKEWVEEYRRNYL